MAPRVAAACSRAVSCWAGSRAFQAVQRNRIIWCKTLAPSRVSGTAGRESIAPLFWHRRGVGRWRAKSDVADTNRSPPGQAETIGVPGHSRSEGKCNVEPFDNSERKPPFSPTCERGATHERNREYVQREGLPGHEEDGVL